MSNYRRLSIIAMAMLLVIVGTAHASDPPTSHAAGDWLPGIQDSRDLSGPALVTGRLVNPQGQGVSGYVTAVAWPTMDLLGALKTGDQINTVTVAKTISAPNGDFTLRVDPNVPISQYAESDGTVNLELRAVEGGHVGIFSFARRLSADQSTWLEPGSASSSPAENNPIDLMLGIPSGHSSAGTAPVPAMNKDDACPDTVEATYDQVYTVIGEVYTGPHAYGDFEYINGSASALGVGFSSSGDFGSFSQNGTASSNSTVTLDYPQWGFNTNAVPETAFQYKKFDVWIWVWDPYLGGYCEEAGHEVRPTAFQGALDYYYTGSPPSADYCSFVAAGGSVTKDTADAITFSNGVFISSLIGIDLSSKTGFNSETKIKFDFQTDGDLCGTNATYPNAARVVAK